jgi:hypothetical protein
MIHYSIYFLLAIALLSNNIALGENQKKQEKIFLLHGLGNESMDCNVKIRYPMSGNITSMDITPEGGKYTLVWPINSKPAKLDFSLTCLTIDYLNSNPRNMEPVAFDPKIKKWVKNIENDNEYHQSIKKTLKIYNINASNSSGYFYTTDESNDAPHRKNRKFSFCMFKPPMALCGGGKNMRLQGRRIDLTPFALELVKSTEFIEIGNSPQR